MRRGPFLLMPAFAACLDPYVSESPLGTGTGTSTGPGSTGGAASTGGAGGTGSTGGSSSTGSSGHVSEGSTADLTGGMSPRFDVGGVPDLTPLPVGCRGKIDFLFVVSSHDVMKPPQKRLIAAFPQFMATMQSKYADFDYHVMVVNADPSWGDAGCNVPPCPAPNCGIEDYPTCEEIAGLSGCDKAMGAGTLFNAGWWATNERCELASGNRYLTSDDADPLGNFACMARVGVSGWDLMADAMLSALSSKMNEPGGCNEGFLRHDALLVVTLVTDTGDYHSEGTPEEWMQAVVAAKQGDPKAVVLFAIDLPKWLCEMATIDRVCKFAVQFPYWHAADTDIPDYQADFEIAADLIHTACYEMVVDG